MNPIEAALQAALALAARGFPVFPCNDAKSPTCPGGFKRATRDANEVRALWAAFPGVLVGIPTGEVSGIAVLDIDSVKHREAAEWLQLHGPLLPETWIVESRSGGQHWYYQHRAGLRCSVAKIAPGVDVRGDGGYVICWSAHGCPVFQNAPLAPWPAYLDDILAIRPETGSSGLSSPDALKAIDSDALAAIVRQLPNDKTFDDRTVWVALAHALAAAFADDPSTAEELWLAHAAKREQTPDEPERVWATLQSPHRAGAGWIVATAKSSGIDTRPYEVAEAAAIFRAAGPLPLVTTAPNPTLPGQLEQAIARLAALDTISYEACRKVEAQALGLRIGVLDRAVEAARGTSGGGNKQGSPLGLAAPEPWPERVDGAELLCALADFFASHAVLLAGAGDLLAVWSVHTHCFDCARHTPRLAISSPEKQCGKTTVLDLLQMVVCKPLPTANVTAAAVFRTVEACAPTLLVDEADTFLGENEGLRGVLNAGHKRGGQVIRCVGDDAEPRTFAAYAPAAIASIGALPGTIADRSVQVTMRRATQAEQPQPIRGATEAAGAVLARRAARWATDHAAALHDRDPTLPDWMTNRVADNWRCLLAIAEVAGGEWPARLEKAAKALANADDGREGLGVALLRDVRTIFAEAFPAVNGVLPPVDIVRISTAEIVRCLIGMEDRPWPEIGHGKALTPTRFTRMVKPFGIVRKQWRVGNTDQRFWGFQAVDFNDAFNRYLPTLSADAGDKTGDVVTGQGNPGAAIGS